MLALVVGRVNAIGNTHHSVVRKGRGRLMVQMMVTVLASCHSLLVTGKIHLMSWECCNLSLGSGLLDSIALAFDPKAWEL